MHTRLVLLTLLAGGGALAQPPVADDLGLLASWFAGEWNNHEQVWQQKIDLADPKIVAKVEPNAHLHQLHAPVTAPGIGVTVFHVQQSAADAASRAMRQRLLRFTPDAAGREIRQESFRFKDDAKFADAQRQPERFTTLAPEDLLPMPGCDVRWRLDNERKAFIAAAAGPCVDRPMQRLEAGLLQTASGGVPDRQRRVRYFEGWVWIKHAGPQATADDKKTSFTRRVQLHTEGQRIPVLYEDGTASPYLLELALLTYQNTRQAILKFALLDQATGKSLTYIWANTDATRIGMNLGWFQAGLTQKTERVHYGF